MTIAIVVRHVFFSNGFCPSSMQAYNPLYRVNADELEEKLDFLRKENLLLQSNRINILFYKVHVVIKQNLSQ